MLIAEKLNRQSVQVCPFIFWDSSSTTTTTTTRGGRGFPQINRQPIPPTNIEGTVLYFQRDRSGGEIFEPHVTVFFFFWIEPALLHRLEIKGRKAGMNEYSLSLPFPSTPWILYLSLSDWLFLDSAHKRVERFSVNRDISLGATSARFWSGHLSRPPRLLVGRKENDTTLQLRIQNQASTQGRDLDTIVKRRFWFILISWKNAIPFHSPINPSIPASYQIDPSYLHLQPAITSHPSAFTQWNWFHPPAKTRQSPPRLRAQLSPIHPPHIPHLSLEENSLNFALLIPGETGKWPRKNCISGSFGRREKAGEKC